MTAQKILLVGYGDLAHRLAPQLIAQHHHVFAIARKQKPVAEGVVLWRGAISDVAVQSHMSETPADVVIITLTPDGRREADYRQAYLHNVKSLLACWKRTKSQPKQVIFVSSTSVYRQNQGEWVAEITPADSVSPTASVLIESEQLLLTSTIPSCIVRFAGIYGPGRDYLINQVKSGIAGTEAFTNRIHVDDCVAVLGFLVDRCMGDTQSYVKIPNVLLAGDCEPVTSKVVREWLCEQLGFPATHLAPTESPSSRVSGLNKRCDNSALLAMGYTFKYPSFRDGYGEQIALHRHDVDSE